MGRLYERGANFIFDAACLPSGSKDRVKKDAIRGGQGPSGGGPRGRSKKGKPERANTHLRRLGAREGTRSDHFISPSVSREFVISLKVTL